MLEQILYSFIKNWYMLITENIKLPEKYKERKKKITHDLTLPLAQNSEFLWWEDEGMLLPLV